MSVSDLQDTFREYLEGIYNVITNTRLVQTKRATDKNMTEFINILNTNLPKDEHMLAAKAAFRVMYTANRKSMTKYLCNPYTRSAYMCVWTDGPTIARVLDIDNIVEIHWDKEAEQFIILKRNVNRKITINTRNFVRTKLSKERSNRYKYFARPKVYKSSKSNMQTFNIDNVVAFQWDNDNKCMTLKRKSDADADDADADADDADAEADADADAEADADEDADDADADGADADADGADADDADADGADADADGADADATSWADVAA